MSGVTVVRAGGRLLAVKRGDPARLRHEAAVLRRLDHPGLVSFMSLDEAGPVELRTLFAGSDSWHRRPPADERAIVSGLAAIAATIADLHDVDATHGSIAPAHVLSASGGRPVLCSLGDSGDADDAGRSADMGGLGALIDHCRTNVDGALGRRLQMLAARSRDSSLDARALARELDALEPATTGGERAEPRRRLIALCATAMAAVAGIGWATLRHPPDERATAPSERQTTTTFAPSTTTTTTTTRAIPPSTTTRASATAASPAAPVDDIAPPELVHDGRRYQVGRGGDLAVVGDWNCDGIDTPALFRADASLVAVFDAWPPPGGTVEPAHIATVTGTTLDREAHDECDLLRVRTATGSELVVLPTTP